MAEGGVVVVGIGRRIHEARNLLGLTQEDLASRLDVARETVSAWERGANIPRGDKSKRLANALGVTSSWLLKGDPSSSVIRLSQGPAPAMPDDAEVVQAAAEAVLGYIREGQEWEAASGEVLPMLHDAQERMAEVIAGLYRKMKKSRMARIPPSAISHEIAQILQALPTR